MKRVRLSEEARQFLETEARYLKRHSSSSARRFLNRMTEARRNLSLFPDMGSETDGFPVPGARRLVAGDYIVIYEVSDDAVAITSIRHGRMTPESHGIEDDFDYEA